MKRVLAQPWLVLALIFLLGMGTGVLLTIAFGPGFWRPPGAQEMRNRWMMHLTHHLNLTADQQAKIQPIVTDAETRIEAVHHDDVLRISAILKETTGKISALLTPEQQTALSAMERSRERMFQSRMGPGHHPPGSRPDADEMGHREGPPPGPAPQP